MAERIIYSEAQLDELKQKYYRVQADFEKTKAEYRTIMDKYPNLESMQKNYNLLVSNYESMIHFLENEIDAQEQYRFAVDNCKYDPSYLRKVWDSILE